MSIQDETWDRPYCSYCEEIIKFGDYNFHFQGVCLPCQDEDYYFNKFLADYPASHIDNVEPMKYDFSKI